MLRRIWTLVFISGAPEPLIGPQPVGVIGSLGYALLALLIFFSPRALAQPASAPAARAVSNNPVAFEKTADQAKPGTVS